MKKPKISIITVSYNADDTIEQTIKSVISQGYENTEYVIIDGASTDSTVDIIRKYEEYISYWISEPDDGVYDAMNKGLDRCTGDIVAFLNSDDYYLEKTLEYVAEYYQNRNPDILCCDVMIEQDGELFPQKNPWKTCPEKLREGFMMYSHQGIFAKRECFLKYGKFDISYKITADYDWLLRVYNQNVRLEYSPNVVAIFRYGGISTTNPIVTAEELEKVAVVQAQEALQLKKISRDEYEVLYNKICNMIRKRYLYAYAQKCEQIMRLSNDSDDSKYVIFGMGELGTTCYKIMNALGMQVDFFVDNNPARWETRWDGIEIKSPHEILNKNVFVIVASQYYEEEIFKQLEQMGLKRKIDYSGCSQLCEKIKMISE